MHTENKHAGKEEKASWRSGSRNSLIKNSGLRNLSLSTAAAALLCLTAAVPSTAEAALNAHDACLCEALIDDLENEHELTFIRNGEIYDSVRAAEHLRYKFERAQSRLNTVNDFIERLASESWLSGEPYLVVLPDGTELKARDYLFSRLEEVRAQCPLVGGRPGENNQ